MPRRLLGEVVAIAIGQGQAFRLEDFDESHYCDHRLVTAHVRLFDCVTSAYEKSRLKVKNYKKVEQPGRAEK